MGTLAAAAASSPSSNLAKRLFPAFVNVAADLDRLPNGNNYVTKCQMPRTARLLGGFAGGHCPEQRAVIQRVPSSGLRGNDGVAGERPDQSARRSMVKENEHQLQGTAAREPLEFRPRSRARQQSAPG